MATLRIAHDEYRNGGLPPICMACGEPADEFEPVRHRFTWTPPWIALFILLGLAGLVVILILWGVLRKARKLETPFCEEHRGYWTARNWINPMVLLSIFGLIAAIITLASFRAQPWMYLAAIGAFLVFLITAAVFQNRSIRPTYIGDIDMVLVNVNRDFRDAVEQDRAVDKQELQEFRKWKREQGRDESPRES